MPNRYRIQKGVSLIELLLFIALVSFFVITSMQLLRYIPAQTIQPPLSSLLAHNTQEFLENFKYADYDEIVVGEFEQYNQQRKIKYLIQVEYHGERFLLDNDRVKNITITAHSSEKKSITLSVYRFAG